MIAEYLWHAEGGLVLILAAAFGYALFRAWRDRRLAWYAGGALLVISGLVLLSDPVLFPVFGRRVREVMPFLCLGAAMGIVRFIQGRRAGRGAWTAVVALGAGAVAAWNFSGPLRQVFPEEFRRLAAAAAARQTGLPRLSPRPRGEDAAGRRRWTMPRRLYLTILRRPHPLPVSALSI